MTHCELDDLFMKLSLLVGDEGYLPTAQYLNIRELQGVPIDEHSTQVWLNKAHLLWLWRGAAEKIQLQEALPAANIQAN